MSPKEYVIQGDSSWRIQLQRWLVQELSEIALTAGNQTYHLGSRPGVLERFIFWLVV